MDGTAAPPDGLIDFTPMSGADDPRVAGLERKLDVLRAQLDAAREGRDPDAAGPATWSRLEQQDRRIADLESALGTARRDWLMTKVELSRARDEVLASQRSQQQLGAMLVELSRRDQITVVAAPPQPAPAGPDLSPEPAPERHREPAETAEAELLRAVLASSSWRLTRPLRVMAHRLKGHRGPTP